MHFPIRQRLVTPFRESYHVEYRYCIVRRSRILLPFRSRMLRQEVSLLHHQGHGEPCPVGVEQVDQEELLRLGFLLRNRQRMLREDVRRKEGLISPD